MVSYRGNILRITGLLIGFDVFCVVRLKKSTKTVELPIISDTMKLMWPHM